MISSNGKTYPTIVDAAKEFGVAPKTVRDWIEKRRIPEPPTVQIGIRSLWVFPPEYLKVAGQQLQAIVKEKDGLKRKKQTAVV